MSSGLNLSEGDLINNKYEVVGRLGGGWEGEVYLTRERITGIERTAKFFYPNRNKGNKIANLYAQKLHRLRETPAIIQYHNLETVDFEGTKVTCLLSEFVHGELLSSYLAKHGGRLHSFQALTIFYHMVKALEGIHEANEYHGDLHSDNIFILQQGTHFKVKFIDFYFYQAPIGEMKRRDLTELVKIFYELIGGIAHYRDQPQYVKDICCGLKDSLIIKKFKNATGLRLAIEALEWT
jgi:serine/threonine protein kinase